MRMEGKIALVTGGAGGIGSAICRLFAAEGAKVVVADVDSGRGEEVVTEIRGSGGEAIYIDLDVTKEEDWERAVAATVERFGGLNVLVNNAGAYSPELVADTPLETWERIMAVNATGTFLGSKHAIPEMKRSGGGIDSEHVVGCRDSGECGRHGIRAGQGGGEDPDQDHGTSIRPRRDSGQLHPPGPYRHAHAPRPDARDGR